MFYEYDSIKAQLNLAKHGVSFKEAISVFSDSFALVAFDKEHSSLKEDRFFILGLSDKERILLVVHCYKKEDTIRIISARKATKKEKSYYKKGIK